MESILTSIKKLLGIAEDYEQFDPDIIMHINSVFFVLNQLGAGPELGFSIVNKTAIWKDYTGVSTNLEIIKSYVYLKVKLIFDPPTTVALIEAIKNQIQEFEWRIYVMLDPKIVEEVTCND